MNRPGVGRTRAALRRGLARRTCRAHLYLARCVPRRGRFVGQFRACNDFVRGRTRVSSCPAGGLPRRGPPEPDRCALVLDLDLDRLRLDLLRLRDAHRQHAVLVGRLAALGVEAGRELDLAPERGRAPLLPDALGTLWCRVGRLAAHRQHAAHHGDVHARKVKGRRQNVQVVSVAVLPEV